MSIKGTCFARGCTNKVNQKKSFFQDLTFRATPTGRTLEVRCMVKLCVDCDKKLHSERVRDDLL